MGEVSISEVFDTAIGTAQTLISQKGLTLLRDDGETLPLVWSDRDKLVQVMTNLLSNAIKFTPEDGKIEVNAQLAEESEGRTSSIRISVSDTGISISPGDCQKVFEKFKQVGDNQLERPKGTGLGLAICNEIVQYLGGSMWVESELGKGSTFFFTVASER